MTEKTINATADRRYYNVDRQGRAANVYIYGDIVEPPTLDDSEICAYSLATDIAGLDVDTIDVYISSAGGSVREGLAIYTALCRHPAKVVTHCDAFACSVASVIFMAGDERLMSDVGLLMIHEAAAWAQGNAAELHKAAEDLTTITNAAAAAYKSRVNIGEDELAKMLAAETWLTPGEAVVKGFATGIESRGKNEGAAMSGRGRIADLIQRGLAQKAPEPAAADLAGTVAELKNDVKSLLAEMGELAAAMKAEPQKSKAPAGGFFNFKKNE